MQLLSPKKLAEILDVHITTIYGWISRKQLKYYKINNLVKFDADDIEAWLEAKKVGPYNYKD